MTTKMNDIPMTDTVLDVPPTAASPARPRRKLRARDGLFQRGGWWWLDYTDAEGKRHRKKAAPDYDTAKKKYRALMTAIARGEVLGVREEGLRLRDFVERRYWPAVKGTLKPTWADRSKRMPDVASSSRASAT